MAYRHLLGLLGFGPQRRRCSSLGPSLRRGITQLSESVSPAQGGASQPTAILQVPYGRQYLPAATSHQLLTAGSSVSITVAADPKRNAHIVVINNGSSSPPGAAAAAAPPALSGAAQATAAGTWPALPTWLFGFACGGAAATAMTYKHLNPQPAAATASGLRHSSSLATYPYSSSSSTTDGSNSLAASVLTGVSYSHSNTPDSSNSSNSGDSSSSSGDTSSSSSGSILSNLFGNDNVWRLVLQPLSRFGARPAHAAVNPQVSGQQRLPTPWEHEAAAAAGGSTDRSSTAAAVHPPAGGDAVMMRNSISRAAAAVAPAVVHIVSTDNGSSSILGPRGVFDRPQGSGFIYDPRGYVLTNAHVILGTQPAMPGSSTGIPWQQQSGSKRSLFKLQKSSSSSSSNTSSSSKNNGSNKSVDGSSVSVHLADGRVYDGRCIALDVPSDLAVVEINAPEQLPYCSLGHSNRLYVGDWVVAVGSPFLLKQSVTAGIVSCVERKGSELGMVTSPRTEYIQTDAAINVGNSGGPLINLDGAVIGVNNMKAPAGEGLSFAIPIDTVKTILSEISRHGHVRRPYVGITMAEVNPSRMAQLRQTCPDFPADIAAGIVVTRVTKDSPAAAAGLHEDDVIVGILPAGGSAATAGGSSGSSLSVSSLADALKAGIGGRVSLLVVREQRQHQASGKQASSGHSSRYAHVTVTVEPVEAPHSSLG